MPFAFLKLDNKTLFTALKEQGFKAISDKYWQKLLKGMALVENNEFAHFKLRKQIKHLREQATDATFTDSARTLLHLGQWVAPTYLTWKSKQIALLNNAAWWEKRVNAAKRFEKPKQDKAIETIRVLRQQWEQQNPYAFYSTLDLINIYETVFPLFSEWLFYAQTELQHKRQPLPESILKDYERYLANASKTIAAEKRHVRMALKARLMAGLTQQNFQCDEVISPLHARLHALDVLPSQNRSPNHDLAGYITPDIWLKMQHIIEQESNEAEKADWYSLSYNAHRNPKDLLFYEHYRSTPQGHTYRIPAELAEYLPIAPPFYLQLPRFLHWFFMTERFYYTFFQHPTCQYLLAMEQSFEQWKCPRDITLDTLGKNLSWQGLQHLWDYLDAEKARIEQAQKHRFSFVRRDITPLLDSYHQHLEAFANEVVMRHMVLINEVLKPFDQKNLTDHEKQQLEQFLSSIQQTENRWKRTADVKMAVSHLILHCHHLLNRPVVTTKTLEKATSAMDGLNKGEMLAPDALEAIKTTQESLALGGECINEANAYTKACFSLETSLAKEKIPDLFKAELLQSPLEKEQTALTNHLQALRTYHAWILREKPPLIDPTIVNDQLCYYAYSFLQAVHQLSSKEAFLAKISTIRQVVGALHQLTETTCSALHSILTPVTKMDITQPLYHSGWKFFCQIELEPPLNTLKEYLISQGVADNLSPSQEASPTPQEEKGNPFKKVFVSTPNIPSTDASHTVLSKHKPTFT